MRVILCVFLVVFLFSTRRIQRSLAVVAPIHQDGLLAPESCEMKPAFTSLRIFSKTMLSKTAILNPASGTHRSTVILMHGLGDTAAGWIDAAQFWQRTMPDTRFVLPTAPSIPVTLNGGYVMPAWYDLQGLSERDDETCNGIEMSRDAILDLIESETVLLKDVKKKVGKGEDRIVPLVLAGFSQGAALSLFTGLQQPRTSLAGIVCMSGYLPKPDKVCAVQKKGISRAPVFMAHGNADMTVKLSWATSAKKKIDACCETASSMKIYDGLAHSVDVEELNDVCDFMKRVLGDAPVKKDE